MTSLTARFAIAVAALTLGLLCLAGRAGKLATLLVARPGSQAIQNARADADDLSRMKNAAMVRRFANAGLLAHVPVSTRYYYLSRIPSRYRYLRPWTKLFVERLGRQYRSRFKRRLRLTSLVRTAALQQALTRRNGNAAPAWGRNRSSHLTGATVDISKRYMEARHIDWMRGVLHHLNRKRVTFAIEEFGQPTFHVMVHRSYLTYVRRLENSKPSEPAEENEIAGG